MATTILALSFLAVGAGFAVFFYVRRRGKVPAAFFLVIRGLILVALLLAFFEPIVTFEQLATKQRTVPVLVDASMSMRLFRPDSVILPFLGSLDSLGRAHPDGPKFKFYCFGDSLRDCPEGRSIRFSDLQSFFPASEDAPLIRDAPFVLIVSDGNLSNVSHLQGGLQDKSCYYLELPAVAPRPYLQAEILNAPENVALDSASVITVGVRGFAPAHRTLAMTCRRRGSAVLRKSIFVDSGYFSDTVALRLPPGPEGRHVYSVLIENAADTLRSAPFFCQTVFPRQFVAAIYSAAPLLDRRFLTNALAEDGQWRIAPLDARRCDALFLFDCTGAGLERLRQLGPRGLAVFLGAIPCSSRVETTPASFSLLPADPYDTTFARFAATDVAPPSHILTCAAPFLRRSRVALFALARRESGPFLQADTVPFLAAGSFEGHEAAVVFARGLWRCDFLSISVARERETPALLSCLVSFAKQRLVANLRDNLAAYPREADLFERDSLPFTVLLPPIFDPSAAGAGAGASSMELTIRFAVESAGRTCIDSWLPIAGMDPENRALVKLPPLGAGTYAFTCSAIVNGSIRSYSDTMYVGTSSPELSVQSQNTLLLGEIAAPLRPANAQAALAAFTIHSQAKRMTVARYFQVRQTWALLAVIFGLWAAEWIVRRKQGLD
jgi:hypothetical protein